MFSFFEHVPERYRPELREIIDSITETRLLLDQVLGRFGTKEPEELRAKIGQSFDGVTVSEESVVQLQSLLRLHEERRQSCRMLMERINGKPAEGESAPEIPGENNSAPDGETHPSTKEK